MHPGEEKITASWFDRFLYHDVTREIAERAGALRYHWRKLGKTLSLADATIAAVALHHRLVLLTDNDEHFPMPEIVRSPFRQRFELIKHAEYRCVRSNSKRHGTATTAAKPGLPTMLSRAWRMSCNKSAMAERILLTILASTKGYLQMAHVGNAEPRGSK